MKIEDFTLSLSKSTAHRKSREEHRDFIFYNNELLPIIFDCGCQINNDFHHKAWWIMELIFEEKTNWLLPYFDDFCNIITEIKSTAALRSITKICWFVSKSSDFIIENHHKDSIYQCLFDNALQTEKAANAAYSIYAIYEFGKKDPWLHEELKLILSKGFDTHTPAYRAAAKNTLKRLKK